VIDPAHLAPAGTGPMARIVRLAVVVVTIALFAGATINSVVGERELAVIFALAAPLGISAWGFVRAGHNEPAILLLCMVLTVVVTLVLMLSPLGVHDVAITAYGGVILFAALLLSRRAFYAVAAAIVLAASTAFIADLMGLTRSRIALRSDIAQFVEFLAIVGVFALLGRGAVEIATGSLGAAQRASAGDPVTGLDNRAAFFQKAEQALARLRAAATPAVLVILDIEAFRRVNVVVGHRAGDGLLREVATRLNKTTGSHLVGRIGDDEFAVLATGVAEAGAEAFAREVHEAVTFDTLGVSLRSRLGYARFPRDAATLESLLLAAESALAQAKNPDAGRFGAPAQRI
jgi:diguanylate cyclase (GGDEF)-like protein